MNEKGVEVLVNAALKGLPQDFSGGLGQKGKALCAVRRLASEAGTASVLSLYGLRREVSCPMGCKGWRRGELGMVVHLNDFHKADYLTIARKLGGDT